MTKESKDQQTFLFLSILTGFFLLLQLSFFLACNKVYFVDFTHVAANLTIPRKIYIEIFLFILIELGLHFFYLVLVWYLTKLVSSFFNLYDDGEFFLGIAVFVGGALAILLSNQYLYPNSKFAELTTVLFSNLAILKLFLYPLLFFLLIIVLLAVIQFILSYGIYSILFLIIFTSLYITTNKTTISPTKDAGTSAKPNIIIIGVDALRPDFLNFFGHDNIITFFDSYLNQATVFSDAITPLARTFPSWSSLLTGQYPYHNGVRFNLTKPSHIHLRHSLPSILREYGYQTAYATDETRFSNIDHYFGFNQIITAPMGLNDFIVGTFNDFPLSNLLVNTKIGQWLFPYSYGNRAVYFTYDPNSFLQRLIPFLQTPRSKPLFLSIHFCLPHFPNLWASARVAGLAPSQVYQVSVMRAAEQVKTFMQALKSHNILQHAIVVLVSDHGEALALQGDRITERELFQGVGRIPKFYPASTDEEDINQSAGHGTDVLGLSQYHVIMAFKFYGFNKNNTIKTVNGLVTLLDIKPTILELLNIEGTFKSDGTSLAALLENDKTHYSSHDHIFIESDYSPQSVRTVYPETRQVMLDGIKLFEIDPISTRLTIKNKMGEMIITSKQYADIYRNWMLALYPQNKQFRMPVLINLQTGEWTTDLNSSFALYSPARTMLFALRSFYKNELTGI